MMRIDDDDDDDDDESAAAAAAAAAAARDGGGGGGGGGGGSSGGSGAVDVVKPGWLEGLMTETFFAGCVRHHHRRKNEKNIFCLHCCLSFCLHCLPSHPSNHQPLLQVRRYVYHDVVRLEDLEKLIDCSYIQAYTINGAKVIFLNERARSRSSSSTTSCSSKGSANFCLGCCRILQDPYLFCSLSCKVDYMVYQREDLSSILCRFDPSHHDHIVTFQNQNQNQNQVDFFPGRAASSTFVHQINNNNNNNNNNIDPIPNGKNKSSKTRRTGFLSGIVDLPLMIGNNRRKGAPRRSPLS